MQDIVLLETHLRMLDLQGYGCGNRKKGTDLITSEICNFALKNGYKYSREVYLGLHRPTSNYAGYIDLTIVAQTNRYAIEIDSSNKKWSLQKLLHAGTIGYIPIWVRWSVKIKMDVPKQINLIDLT